MPQPQRDDGGGLTKMAALSEDGSYGLNCGQQNAGRVTVLHVKLTETALKAIESHQKCSVSEWSLYFHHFQPKRAGFGGLTQLAYSWEARLPRTGRTVKVSPAADGVSSRTSSGLKQSVVAHSVDRVLGSDRGFLTWETCLRSWTPALAA